MPTTVALAKVTFAIGLPLAMVLVLACIVHLRKSLAKFEHENQLKIEERLGFLSESGPQVKRPAPCQDQ